MKNTKMLFYNLKLKRYSQELRKNMTDAERLLWSKLRKRQLKGLQFYRQRIIGNYIVDFYCPKANLVIELDGGQHYTDRGIKEDKHRENYIKRQGLEILRFSDIEVFTKLLRFSFIRRWIAGTFQSRLLQTTSSTALENAVYPKSQKSCV